MFSRHKLSGFMHRGVGWLLFSCIGTAQAQFGSGFTAVQNDSALIALRGAMQLARHDTTRIDLWEKMSVVYLNKDKPDSAFTVLQQGLRLASQSRRPLDLGRIHRGLGEYYYYQRLAPQLLDNYQKAVRFFLKAHRVPDASREMYHVAQGYAMQSDYAKTVEQCNKCLGYAHQTGYYNLASYSYALLYTIHLQFGDKKKAFADLQAMQKVAQRHPTTLNRYLTNINVAEWYDLHHQYAKALPYWQLTLIAAKESRVPTYVVEAYNGLATDFLKLKNFSATEDVLIKGFAEIAKSDPLSSTIYRTLALLREHQNRLPEAQQATLTAIVNARKTHHPFLTKAGLETLLRLQEKQGQHRQALITSHRLTTLRDSLNEVNQIQRINEVESKQALDEKEKDLKLLRQKALIQTLEVERSQKQTILYSSIAIGLLLLLLLMGWIVVLDRRHLRELNRQKTKITTQALKLSELNTVKDKLFSLIGHDLRTPVLDLKFNVDLLDQKQQSEDWYGQHTGQLKRTVNSLYYTVDNLLHWAALQQEGMHTRPEAVSLLDLVMETEELFESTIVQKNITVKIEPGNAFAWTDDGQAQIVIRNIIHNALKFTPSGGHIQIRFEQSSTEAVVRIADTGIGMKLTDPQKASQAISRVGTMGESSTGLGLLICHEFMKRNGGRLEISSTVGEGTVVSLRFKSGYPVHAS